MHIDHIFLFTDDNGRIADQLIKFGLVEGSGRVHAGQGTANRKFYFTNFFLEVLWVHNEAELRSELIRPTGLWQRAEYKRSGYSPYGLCLVNDDYTDRLFENSIGYQPTYFPPGTAIDILTNERNPQLPWTFRLPFKGQHTHETEPTNHPNGIRRLTKANFEYAASQANSYVDHFENKSTIAFSASDDYALTLTFDNRAQGKTKAFEELKLTIEY